MRDRLWILAGLTAFVVFVTIPFWHPLLSPQRVSSGPNLVLPARERQCVAPAAVMRSEHMQLLVNWREDVVRHGAREYVAFNGKTYGKSLSTTCLGCHRKQEFCDRCHAYAGVSEPYCWTCHSEPGTKIARSMP
jgi:hypothetical protein